MSTREQKSVSLQLPAGGSVQVYLSYTGEPHEEAVLYVHGFGSVVTGHWNETGHRQAADEIFSFLRSRGLVPLDDRPVEQARDDR